MANLYSLALGSWRARPRPGQSLPAILVFSIQSDCRALANNPDLGSPLRI